MDTILVSANADMPQSTREALARPWNELDLGVLLNGDAGLSHLYRRYIV